MGRLLMLLLVAGLFLAAAKAVIFVLALAIVLLLIWGFINKPAETIGMMLLGGWLTLLQNHLLLGLLALPAAFLLLGLTKWSSKAGEEGRSQPPLLGHREREAGDPTVEEADDAENLKK